MILDGGSTRVFFPNDAGFLEEDLETLKVIPFTEFILSVLLQFIFLRDIRIMAPFCARWLVIMPVHDWTLLILSLLTKIINCNLFMYLL